jgi:hypothetical protein
MGYKLVATKPEKSAHNFVYLASDERVNYSGYFLKKPGKSDVKEKASYDPMSLKNCGRKAWSLFVRYYNYSSTAIFFRYFLSPT